MSSRLLIAISLFITVLTLSYFFAPETVLVTPTPPPRPIWSIRSIDTMKYSRDIAREKAFDVNFDLVIDQQVGNIASTGATHVAIATPYDAEFIPFLTRWVSAARKYNLKVWFRGNFSGWEKWFDYKRISRDQHLAQTKEFITTNAALFEDGDLFTPCPECENGGTGDPRMTRDFDGHKKFLIDSTIVGRDAFSTIGKTVQVGYHSMNYDVAMEIMDKETTAAVGGIVAIDHYVATPEKMIRDIAILKERSGGKIFLGEFGAPIPDINGKMTQEEQADWLERTLSQLTNAKSVIGLNYWVNVGGSTELWDGDGNARLGVNVLTKYFTLKIPQ